MVVLKNVTADAPMIDILLYPLLAGLGVAAVAGPLGSFAVWRKMAYFGDTLAHSALIGVALGLFLSINITLSIIIACMLVAIILVVLEQKTRLATDTLLGILSHTALATGLICVSLYSQTRINLFGLLFGDFLTAGIMDVVTIYSVAVPVIIIIVVFWRKLLMICMDEDMARVEGHHVVRLRLLLMMLMAIVIALAMKVVGVLLITALLIIPAASSRRITTSPEAMAIIASVLASLAVISGLLLSFYFDIPAGPGVVVACSFLFATVTLFSMYKMKA